MGNVVQETTNKATVVTEHQGSYNADPSTLPGLLKIGNITGDGASVSVSATGAVASVSLTSINNTGAGVTPDADFGNITQKVVNQGDVSTVADFHPGTGPTEADSVITTGTISGTAASASISATGAIAAVSVASINDTQGLGSTVTGDITQTATSSGAVSNMGADTGTGVINTGALTGAGTSASVSATGAAASVSFSAVK